VTRGIRLMLALTGLMLGIAAAGALPAVAATAPTPQPPNPGQTLEQAISDFAQSTTIGFSGVAMLTGNLDAQSFFPPGKLADYWGFQELRDNDPSGMGHNTSFLTRVACDMLYNLDASQVAKLTALAKSQVAQINEYGYERYPLMQAFRRLVDGDLPAGTSGLDEAAVARASADLYELDGQICYDRAVLYAEIFRSFTPSQKAFMDAMVGKGWSAWPEKTMEDVREKTQGLSRDESVVVMTYAGDMYSWYAGDVDKDVYFCPERHGTYYGGFYIKDAPAIGHEGYSINEQLTATAGACLSDASKGFVTAAQAALVNGLLDVQRDNLYKGTDNIVKARTDISTALRSLISSTAPSAAALAAVKQTVLARSAAYGRLDGEDNYHYVVAFAQLNASLSAAQKAKLMDLRKSIMNGAYADGTPFDFTVCTTPFLFSAAVSDAEIALYLAKSGALFAASTATAPEAAFTFAPASPPAGLAVSFSDASSGAPTVWAWSFGDGGTSTNQNPSHTYAASGTYTVTLTVTGSGGSDTATQKVAVTAACSISGVSLTRSPFGLRVTGTGFKPGCRVYIGGRVAPTTVYKSPTTLLVRGASLAARLPKGKAVQIVVRNADGSRSAPYAYTR
jgi:hypothetical protein